MSETSINLPVPPADEPRAKSQSFIEIIENRRSIREQGRQPLVLEHLARLLYFTARIKQRLPGDSQELLLRPAPAAGAIHEIEFYLAIGQCQGVNRGLYHYHAKERALYRLPTSEHTLSVLLDVAAVSWRKPHDPPQVLIILASRVPRIAWKYEGIAYRLSLLNAGVIMQTLYLLSTEMRLACSAIGGGDSSVFATATGQDPLAETSIAEFAVGSLAEDAL
jgi:SagB-type dehydrogenase family enzyme